MKSKYLFISLIFFLTVFQAEAQHGKMSEEKRERIKAQKVGYLTEQLKLTVEEAQRFWPLYNEYEAKKEKIHENRKNQMITFQEKSETLSDKELDKMAEDLISTSAAETKLIQEYHPKFKAILAIKKVCALYQAEFQFRNKLLKQLRNRDHEGGRKDKD